MDLGSTVIADEQPLEVVQPGEGALDDPAGAAEPRTVLAAAAGDLGPDPTSVQLAPLRPVVVGTIGGEALGATARAADLASHRRDPLEQRQQLGYVVAIAAGERPGERDAARFDQEMVFRAVSGSINRARARRGAPFLACT